MSDSGQTSPRIQRATEERAAALDHAESMNEAAGEAVGVADEAMGGVVGPFGVAVGLIYDPARFLRTPGERQHLFFRRVAKITASTLGSAWVGMACYTLAVAVERWWSISFIPGIMTESIPTWFSPAGIRSQLLLLLLAALAIAVSCLLVVVACVCAGRWKKLESLFAFRVESDDLVSTVLDRRIRESPELTGVPTAQLRDLIYVEIIVAGRHASPDDAKTLSLILKGGNERAVAAFVKSRVRKYRKVMAQQVEERLRKTTNMLRDLRARSVGSRG